ncbi:MAG: DUF4407 domain-containing protein [Proteobacteria bacterium]|nr:DUF4407 domain-containing protein [Pseudomonadota bacterium]
MYISTYLWSMAGERPQRVRAWQQSSQRRLTAFGIAIHIPVLLWLLTGYLLASTVFHLAPLSSACVALGCAFVIYLVERLILAAPATWKVSLFRIAMGLVIALIGASAVDLVLFDKEINQQLQKGAIQRTTNEFAAKKSEQVALIAEKKDGWERSVAQANCEANGTCGSKRASTGPIYAELKRQEALRRQAYLAAEARLPVLDSEMTKAIELAEARATEGAGLLERLEALHAFLAGKPLALITWVVFFAFMVLLELMVVVTKWAFGRETIDEKVERLKEAITLHKAKSHHDLMTSPTYESEKLILACS